VQALAAETGGNAGATITPTRAITSPYLRYAWLGGPRGQRDPMLLQVLQTVLPEASLLLDVTNGLQTSAQKGGTDKLLYDRRVPEELENLRVGAKP